MSVHHAQHQVGRAGRQAAAGSPGGHRARRRGCGRSGQQPRRIGTSHQAQSAGARSAARGRTPQSRPGWCQCGAAPAGHATAWPGVLPGPAGDGGVGWGRRRPGVVAESTEHQQVVLRGVVVVRGQLRVEQVRDVQVTSCRPASCCKVLLGGQLFNWKAGVHRPTTKALAGGVGQGGQFGTPLWM